MGVTDPAWPPGPMQTLSRRVVSVLVRPVFGQIGAFGEGSDGAVQRDHDHRFRLTVPDVPRSYNCR